jgi:hypothetical protein
VNVLAGLLSIVVPLLLGFAVVRALGVPWRADRLAAAGYSYVAGALTTGLVLAAWLIANLPLDRWLLNGVLLAAAAAIELAGAHGARRRSRGAAPAPPAEPPARPARWKQAVFWVAFTIATAVVCDHALLASLRPVFDSDEAFIWSPRAKVLFHAGGMNEAFRAEMLESSADAADVVSHKDYPLLNSLLHLLVYVDAGRITDFENRLPMQAFGLALVCIAGAALRRLAGPLVAAAMLVVLISETPVAYAFRFSMADGMVSIGLLCAADCFLREKSTGERDFPNPREAQVGVAAAAWARMGGLSLAFLAWTKHEGVMLAALFAVLILVFSRRRAAAWLVPPLFVVGLTWAINHWFGFRNDLVQSGTAEGPIWPRLLAPFGERGAMIAAWFWRDYAGNPKASRLLLFPLVLAPFHPAVRERRVLFATAVALALAVVADLWIFASTPRPFEWHWGTAGVRVLSQLNPAIALVVGAMGGAVISAARVRTASAPT